MSDKDAIDTDEGVGEENIDDDATVSTENDGNENLDDEEMYGLGEDDLNRLEELDPNEMQEEQNSSSTRRHSSRAVARITNYNDMDGIYDGDDTGSGDETGQLPLDESLYALKSYFHTKLCEGILEFGGDADVMKNWSVQVFRRRGGVTGGTIDVVYFNPRHKKFKSRTEVAVALGLIPYARNFSTMSRLYLFDLAREYRQKNIISQLLFTYNGICEGIIEENDGDTISFTNAIISDTKTTSIDNTNQESNGIEQNNINNCYFTYGNTTVINWGNINKNTGFHTVNQLFPIGKIKINC